MPSYKEKHVFPERIKLADFSGLTFTLNSDPSAWREIGDSKNKDGNSDIILLGIAPGHLEDLPFVREALQKKRKIYWLEAPETLKQLYNLKTRYTPLNSSWIQIDPEYLKNSSLEARIFFYEPGRRLAPEFWGSIISQLIIKKYNHASFLCKNANSSLAWLPGNAKQLLHMELHEALRNNGINRIISDLPLKPDCQSLEKIWQKQIPDFILSVNFRGLDPEGQIFEICEALNIPIAIWLVDNPWHILSAIRLPWWKRAHIFVSDGDFVSSLQNCGARHVAHCPLASAPHMWHGSIPSFFGPPLFVGRSTFPGQKEFFGSSHVNSDIDSEVKSYLEQTGHYPDYHWWEKKFAERAWPGKGGRKAGFYADYYSAKNRARWLEKAAQTNIRIIGDEGWKKLLPRCTIESQVDYYGALPEIYQNSGAVLNVTSLLIPGSLNQRHFDVWAAGSMLLTDKSRGLNIFPTNLTNPIELGRPEEFPEKYAFWQKRQNLRKDLILAWQEYLKSHHTYTHRIEFIRKLASAS